MDILTYIVENFSTLLDLTIQHIVIVFSSVFIAILTGVPLGIIICSSRIASRIVLGAATVLLTIPSIALFGVLIPILSPIGHGIGTVPAVVAVVLYSLLPIVRNTYVAISGLDSALMEAARGIGLRPWQRLFWIELPMAVPMIMAGVRIAVVSNIGVAAVAAYVGAGGLGRLISRGIAQSDPRQLITGAVAIALLAVLIDLVLLQVQRLLTSPGLRRRAGGAS
ncbi:ABC transporter permease [Ancylobacter sp. A5.8]|uniref:ABC transporter permease n=1 Tax=Ancylobacter gelatini TaxID=2919920 RepID=UPI001F4E6798|nr:ABC transporter permease [Ancylobacter gelatini]MCJ8143919.1 ABC transporter permease [Ancylobacter gelatini]